MGTGVSLKGNFTILICRFGPSVLGIDRTAVHGQTDFRRRKKEMGEWYEIVTGLQRAKCNPKTWSDLVYLTSMMNANLSSLCEIFLYY